MARVLVEGITHLYTKTVKAVDNLTMECEDGKLTALLGPSGCGKTTLMRIMAGLIYPTSGEVYFDGAKVTDLPPEKRNVAMVFQFPVVYTTMSIYDNLALPLKARGMPENEIKQRIKEAAEFLDLTPYLKRSAGKLTADLKQATSLARAIIRDSNLLLLDEPLTNLDPRFRGKLRDKIVRYKNEKKRTIVYVTHDQGEALTLGDKIGIMKDGRLLQYDTLEDVYDRSRNSYIASFLGNPGMNLLDCSYVRTATGGVLESGGLKWNLPDRLAKTVDEQGLSEVVLGIRPEYVEVGKKEMKEGFGARCEIVEDVGNLRILVLEFAGMRIRAKTLTTDVRAGEKIYVRFPPERLLIFNRNGEAIF